jgi:hypothetical protein
VAKIGTDRLPKPRELEVERFVVVKCSLWRMSITGIEMVEE